jgi:RimJ/RimL family protein N-acetyltransferase
MADRTVIETARLRMREFDADRPEDLAALMAMHREPRLRALLLDDYPLEHEAVARFFLLRMQQIYREHEGLGIWCTEWRTRPDVDATSNEAGAFCGWFNLMRMPDDPSRVEIGCRLLPSAWGRALPIEGGDALLSHAFHRLCLPEVWGVCHPQHRSVHTVLRALGFEYRGQASYDAQPASHFVVRPAAWRAASARALRERLRSAVRQRDDSSACARQAVAS